MMRSLTDCSEIKEALQIVTDLLGPEAEKIGFHIPRAEIRTEQAQPRPRPKPAKAVARDVAVPPPPPPGNFRSEQLDHALSSMCMRGDFKGAVLADSDGLPLSVYESPVSIEIVAAFTSVLGAAIEKAASMLGEHGADNLSMDINYEDKILLKKFTVANRLYYMMIICSQELDQRSEVEMTVEQISAILD